MGNGVLIDLRVQAVDVGDGKGSARKPKVSNSSHSHNPVPTGMLVQGDTYPG